MDLDPKTSERKDVYRLLQACVIPRPIAWVSSLDADGAANLAPFSFFMIHCTSPPIISISTARREDQEKDTRSNIVETGEFVVNVVTEKVMEAMLVSARDFDRGVSEIEEAGLTALPSVKVKPPRIAESPIQMECQLYKTLCLGDPDARWTVLFGEVVHFHVADEIMKDGYVSPDFAPIGRYYGPLYCRTEDRINQDITWAAFMEKTENPKKT